MDARDIMTKNPAYIRPEAAASAAIDLLNELDVRHLPVVENEELVGIISDRDIKSFSAPELERASSAQSGFSLSQRLNQNVSNLMSAPTFFVNPETSIIEVIDIMLDQKISAVPVVDLDNKLVGIVSYIDILREAGKVLGP